MYNRHCDSLLLTALLGFCYRTQRELNFVNNIVKMTLCVRMLFLLQRGCYLNYSFFFDGNILSLLFGSWLGNV